MADIPAPPTPDQLASAGIPLDGPPPPDVGNDDAPPPGPDTLASPEPEAPAAPTLDHLSDAQLKVVAAKHTPSMGHLSDAQLKAIASRKSLSDAQLKDIIAHGHDSGGLDEDRAVDTTGSGVGDFAGSILHGLNKANPFLLAPKAGAYLMNKALTATGAQPVDNPDVGNAIDSVFTPNPAATGINKIGDAAGNMAMVVPETGAALSAIPGVSAAAGATVPWAEPAAGFLGKAGQYASNAGRAALKTGQVALKGAMEAPQGGAASLTRYGVANAGAGGGGEATDEALPKDASPLVRAPADIAGAVLGGGITSVPGIASKYWKYGITPNMVRLPANIAKDSILSHIPDDAVAGDNSVMQWMRGQKDKYNADLNSKAMPKAAEMFKQTVTPEAGQNLADAQRLRGVIGNFDPTLAEATGVPSLVATQKGVENMASGNILDKMAARKQASEQGIQDFVQKQGNSVMRTAAPPTDVAGVPHDEMLNRINGEQERLDSTSSGGDDVDPAVQRKYDALENIKRTVINNQIALDKGVNNHLFMYGDLDSTGIPKSALHIDMSKDTPTLQWLGSTQPGNGRALLNDAMSSMSSRGMRQLGGDYTEDSLPFYRHMGATTQSTNDPLSAALGGAAGEFKFPIQPGVPADITNAVQRRVDAAGKPIDSQLSSVQSVREGAADTLPSTDKYDNGQYLRDRQEALRTDKMGEMNRLADDMGLNDAKNLRVSGKSMQSAVQSALPSGLAAGATPTLRTIAKMGNQPLAFKDAMFLMEGLGSEARQAASAGDAHTAKIATDARSGIDKYLTDEWAPALGIGQKYKDFRQTYMNEYVNRFKVGTGGDTGAVGGDQRFRTDNEDVAGKYFAPGDLTAAKDFHRVFAGDPMAAQALQAHVLDDIRAKTVKDGVIDPAKLDKWVTANPQLSEFPGLQKQVSDLKTLNNDMADRQATLTGRKEAVQDSHLAQLLDKNDVTIDGLLKDKPSFGRVLGNATDDEKASVARQMWDRATQDGKDDPAAMRQFLNDHADVLPQVLSKDHIKSLDDIQKAWEMNARVGAPSGRAVNPATDGSSVKSLTGSSPQTLLSRGFALESGRTGLKYTVADLVARAGLNLKTKQAYQMMDRAMYDPDFAKRLADFVQVKNAANNAPAKIKSMKNYLLNAGINAADDAEEGGDQRKAPPVPRITIHPRPAVISNFRKAQ